MDNVELEKCSCGNSMFTEVQPAEFEEGALTVYRPGGAINYGKSVTVPVLECLVCGRIIATRTSFAGRNRLDPEVQMYARLQNIITKHNEKVRILEELSASVEFVKEKVKKLEESITNGKQAGTRSRTTTKKAST